MSFSELAIQKFGQSFPDLSGFVAAFRDMSDELPEDSSVELGCFILRAGNKTYHVPVVAKSGMVYPIDSVFDSDSSMFFPLTKDTQSKILNFQDLGMGNATKIPSNAVRNPSIYDLVTPPRTGKFLYASKGGSANLVASMSNTSKAMVKKAFEDDAEFARAFAKIVDLRSILEATAPVIPMETQVSAEIPAVQVVTSGKNLPEEIIQEILQEGYAVLGAPESFRMTVLAKEYSPKNYFFNISANPDKGTAYEVVRSNGDTTTAVTLRLAGGKNGLWLLDSSETVHECHYKAGPVAIATKDWNDAFQEFAHKYPVKAINELVVGEKVVILQGDKLVASGDVNSISSSLTEADAQIGYSRVRQYPSYSGEPNDTNGGCIIVGHKAVAFVVGSTSDERKEALAPLEFSVNHAADVKEFRKLNMLPVVSTASVTNSTYAVNGHTVDGRPGMARMLIVHMGVDPSMAKTIIKTAEELHHVKFHMTKEAFSAIPTEIPSYGVDLPEDSNRTGDVRTAAFNKDNAMAGVKTGDESVAEATFISELLQNPDMYGTISTYLPELNQTVDKLGRILFLTRVRSEELSKGMDYTVVDSMISSTRNAYRILGDNCLKLEQLISDDVKDA